MNNGKDCENKLFENPSSLKACAELPNLTFHKTILMIHLIDHSLKGLFRVNISAAHDIEPRAFKIICANYSEILGNFPSGE